MPIGTPSVPYRLPGSQYERWVDIYTRLGVERILFLGQEVNDGIANSLVAQMLYLDSDDNSKPIYLYIDKWVWNYHQSQDKAFVQQGYSQYHH